MTAILGLLWGSPGVESVDHWTGDLRASKKSIGRVKEKVSDILVAGNSATWDEVSDRLNAVLRGWSGYFSYGWQSKAYRAVNHPVAERVRGFLVRRHVMPACVPHDVRGRGYKEFPDKRIHGEFGVLRLRSQWQRPTSVGQP